MSTSHNELLSTKILMPPLRDYVIHTIKAPLQKAIEFAGFLLESLLGPIENTETLEPVTKCLKEHKARFLSYENNPGREPLFSAFYDIVITEVEHDNYYRDRLGAEVEWIIQDVLDGKWQERTNGHPYKPTWNEPEPYGGKYSIVHKLHKHREEILKIIGE